MINEASACGMTISDAITGITTYLEGPKSVMFPPRMFTSHAANTHGNVLDACCEGEVNHSIVTHPLAYILGKAVGGSR